MKQVVPIGLIYSIEGPYRHMGENAYRGALYAINKINDINKDNLMIMPQNFDPKGDLERYISVTKTLLSQNIQHIFGTITSSARKEVLPDIKKAQAMLWYASPYEGYECDENVVYHGSCPNQNLFPLLNYTIPIYGKRVALVASNYIWGWESNRIASELISTVNGEVILEQFYHLGDLDFTNTVAIILSNAPNFVINNLVGESSYAFLEQINNQWVGTPLPILSCNLTECELALLPNFKNLKLITAASFFESVNLDFVNEVKADIGNIPISAYFMGGYLSILTFYHTFIANKGLDTTEFRKVLTSISYESPAGSNLSIECNQHANLPCYIAEWLHGKFVILHTIEHIIPNPFLAKKNILDIKLPRDPSPNTTLRLVS